MDAILAGERDPRVLAKSLAGDYRIEHLFTLRQSLAAYRGYQKPIDDCDREIRLQFEKFNPQDPPAAIPGQSPKPSDKQPSADGILRTELKCALGIDLTKIPGIRTGIAQTLFGEIGPDFRKVRSASTFASWMGCVRTMTSAVARFFGSAREK